MMSAGTMTPAYGRVYFSRAEVLRAWKDGKDFIFNNPTSEYDGKYCSIRDFENSIVTLRYGKQLEHVVIHRP